MPASKAPASLAEALAQFQQEHHAAGKDGKANYGFYTTLAGGLNAVQPATHLGLCHTQTFETIITEHGTVVTVLTTTLKHVSGEEIHSRLPFPELVPNRGNIMQALGSAITYARRYSLLAIYGLAGDDDDADTLTPKLEAKKGISRTPTEPNKSKLNFTRTAKALESTDSANPTQFIDQAKKEKIKSDLYELGVKSAEKKSKVLKDFKEEFKISSKEISPNHITTEAHGNFLAKMIKEASG